MKNFKFMSIISDRFGIEASNNLLLLHFLLSVSIVIGTHWFGACLFMEVNLQSNLTAIIYELLKVHIMYGRGS